MVLCQTGMLASLVMLLLISRLALAMNGQGGYFFPSGEASSSRQHYSLSPRYSIHLRQGPLPPAVVEDPQITATIQQAASDKLPSIEKKERKEKGRSQQQSDKIVQNREKKVSILTERHQEIVQSILHNHTRNKAEVSAEEIQSIVELRHDLQASINHLRRTKEKGLDQYVNHLTSLRDDLPLEREFVNKAASKQKLRERAREKYWREKLISEGFEEAAEILVPFQGRGRPLKTDNASHRINKRRERDRSNYQINKMKAQTFEASRVEQTR